MPGEAQNAAQKRCSSIDAFTGSVRHNLKHHRALAHVRSLEESEHGFNEDTYKFIDKSSISKAEAHRTVLRQADFLAEGHLQKFAERLVAGNIDVEKFLNAICTLLTTTQHHFQTLSCCSSSVSSS